MSRRPLAAPLVVALLVLAAPEPRSFRAFVSLPRAVRPPVVVLPGFGNDSQDYSDGEAVAAGGAPPADGGMAGRLRQRGFASVDVVPVARADWLRVAAALLDADFRAGVAPPSTAFGWYMDRLTETVQQVSEAHGGEKVLLVAHSAGGWLARAALGDGDNQLAARTRALVTLGAPHIAPPPPPLGDDQTRGALRFVDKKYPGAFLRSRGIDYFTIAGSSVEGMEEMERGTAQREAWVSYKRLAGRGDVIGDGIVPLDSSHLVGAYTLTLPNAKHSIGSIGEWYGADAVIDQWLPQVTLLLAGQAALGAVAAAAVSLTSVARGKQPVRA